MSLPSRPIRVEEGRHAPPKISRHLPCTIVPTLRAVVVVPGPTQEPILATRLGRCYEPNHIELDDSCAYSTGKAVCAGANRISSAPLRPQHLPSDQRDIRLCLYRRCWPNWHADLLANTIPVTRV